MYLSLFLLITVAFLVHAAVLLTARLRGAIVVGVFLVLLVIGSSLVRFTAELSGPFDLIQDPFHFFLFLMIAVVLEDLLKVAVISSVSMRNRGAVTASIAASVAAVEATAQFGMFYYLSACMGMELNCSEINKTREALYIVPEAVFLISLGNEALLIPAIVVLRLAVHLLIAFSLLYAINKGSLSVVLAVVLAHFLLNALLFLANATWVDPDLWVVTASTAVIAAAGFAALRLLGVSIRVRPWRIDQIRKATSEERDYGN